MYQTTKKELYGVPVTITIAENCNIVSSTEAATCTGTKIISASVEGHSTATSTIVTTTYSASDIKYDALLVTAGVEKLNSPQATQTPKGAGAMVVAPPVATGHFGLSLNGMAAAAIVAAAGML